MNKDRPLNFKEFVGQKNLIDTLEIFCKVALKEDKALKHYLFYGLPGIGKTSLAYIIANQMNKKIYTINANNIHTQSDLISLFSLINENEIVFIDEIHSLDSKIIELLYPMIEDFYIDIPLEKEFNKKSTRIKLPKFCMIATTTSIGKIPKPLLDRFPMVYKLENYKIEEITTILQNLINKYQYNDLLNKNEINLISENCKENPRIAINLLMQIIDFKKNNKTEDVNKILKKLKIYKYGLTITDIEYLSVIYNAKNNILGIKTLMQITNYDSYTIENYIEPFLFKKNLITKTNKGKALTNKGINLLKQINIK